MIIRKLKKRLFSKFVTSILLIYFEFTAQATGMPVIDIGSITQLLAIYQQITMQLQLVQNLSNDVDNWKRLDWNSYRNHLNILINKINSAREISSDANNTINDFNKYFPGFNYKQDQERISLTNEFMGRSSALLNLLSSQIQVSNSAISNQSEISSNSNSFNSASQIAKASLDSLSQLTTITASEMRAANAYRADQVQKEDDKMSSLKRYIGEKYTPQKNYKTWAGLQ